MRKMTNLFVAVALSIVIGLSSVRAGDMPCVTDTPPPATGQTQTAQTSDVTGSDVSEAPSDGSAVATFVEVVIDGVVQLIALL